MAPAAGPGDPAEVEAFMDGLLAAQLDAYHIPGATVSVVQDGKLIFARGYGYANLKTRAPVLADQTLFHVGSVSKLFIWTAVMQLVEQGKLDLNADVNTYLSDFKIPTTYSQPITLAHLMTHTSGFEENTGLFVQSREEMAPLEYYLVHYMPRRVRPPGVLTAYSNYGAALAGYIVGRVSGEPYEQYLEDHIFKPLAMMHSTFRQPLPPDLASVMATGYSYINDAFQPGPEWVQASPAGALSATATDMANFMIAHLQNGQYGNGHILDEQTALEMHQQLFTNDPRVNGFAHGFMEATINGQHLLWHGGDSVYFHSALVLLPEHNAGIFVSYNSPGGQVAVLNTLRAFMDHYYPATITAPPAASPNAISDGQRVAGSYLPARSNQSSYFKSASLFQSLSLQATSNGGVIISGEHGQPAIHYVEKESLVYIPVDLPPTVYGAMVFHADQSGRVTEMFRENNPTTAYIKAPWYAEIGFSLNLVGVSALLFLSMILGLPIGLWMQRRLKEAWPGPVRMAAWFAGGLSVASVAFIALFYSGTAANPNILFGPPDWFPSLLILPWVIGLLTIAMVVSTIVAWWKGYWSIVRRVHYTIVTLAAIAFTGWLIYWNLLGIPR